MYCGNKVFHWQVPTSASWRVDVPLSQVPTSVSERVDVPLAGAHQRLMESWCLDRRNPSWLNLHLISIQFLKATENWNSENCGKIQLLKKLLYQQCNKICFWFVNFKFILKYRHPSVLSPMPCRHHPPYPTVTIPKTPPSPSPIPHRSHPLWPGAVIPNERIRRSHQTCSGFQSRQQWPPQSPTVTAAVGSSDRHGRQQWPPQSAAVTATVGSSDRRSRQQWPPQRSEWLPSHVQLARQIR